MHKKLLYFSIIFLISTFCVTINGQEETECKDLNYRNEVPEELKDHLKIYIGDTKSYQEYLDRIGDPKGERITSASFSQWAINKVDQSDEWYLVDWDSGHFAHIPKKEITIRVIIEKVE